MNKRKATTNAKCWKKGSLSERHIACLAGDIHCTTEEGPLGLASSSLQLSNTVLIAEWSQLHWLHRRNGLAPRTQTHTHKSKNRKTGCKTLFGSYLWFSSNIKFVWCVLVKLMSFLDAFFFKFPSQDLGGNSWGRLLKSKVNLTMWMVIFAVGLKSENVLKMHSNGHQGDNASGCNKFICMWVSGKMEFTSPDLQLLQTLSW